MIIAAVIVAMVAFSLSVLLSGVQHFIVGLIPRADELVGLFTLFRVVPGADAVRIALPALLFADPQALPDQRLPEMAGPRCSSPIWWLATTALLPVVLSGLGGYDLTYGSLAGVIIGLIFFFIVGLGVVIGAELNAALAEVPEEALKEGEEAFYRTGKHMTGLMERKARPDHGPRQRPVAGLGHREGAWRSRAPSSLSPIRARRCRSGSGRSPSKSAPTS